MFKDIEMLREQIRAFKLNRLEDKIVSLAKPCIHMKLTPVDDASLPAGASRLGGLPDLPANFQWPYYGKKPLTFIAQFKLSEIVPYDKTSILPQHGLLYFFYEADEVPGSSIEERDSWQAIYLEDEKAPLIRTPHPTYKGDYRTIQALPAHQVEFEAGVSLPPIYYPSDQATYGIEFINLPGTDNDPDTDAPTEHTTYFNMVNTVYPEPRHFWLGHPWNIQHYVEWYAITESKRMRMQKNAVTGIYGYTDEQLANIEAEMKQWQFLFQIDTDDSLDVLWGDAGTLYVCIPKMSLAERRFNDCWTLMQCS